MTLQITDSQGNVVLDHIQFPSVHKRADYGASSFIGRTMQTDMDLAELSSAINQLELEDGQTYTYKLTASLSTYEDFVVKEGSFTVG